MNSQTTARQIIVIGSGLAGLASATSALQLGLRVTLLEMDSKFGGNSIKASSGINGAPTRFQPNYETSPDLLFYQDTLKSAGEIYENSTPQGKFEREVLMKTLTENSASAISWLTDSLGVDLSVVAQLGGHSRPRTHRGRPASGPPGVSLIKTLLNNIEVNHADSAKLQTNCKVTKILTDSSAKVIGVRYTNLLDKKIHDLYGPVVVASGGFAGDVTGLIGQYRPDLVNLPSTNSPKEESLSLLTDIGAQLLDMDSIQVHPTGFTYMKDEFEKVKFLAAEALRGEGGILVNDKGERFVNELLTRDKVTEAIKEKCEKTKNNENLDQWESWLIMDESSIKGLKANVEFYIFRKLMFKAKLGELKSQFPELRETLIKYSNSVQQGKDPQLSRTVFGNWKLKPQDVTDSTIIYYGKVTPVLHFTMGGVKFNNNAEILNTNNEPIKNIWGCGEVTAGVHSSNRLAGSSLLECVVFGRIAGEAASKAAMGKSSL